LFYGLITLIVYSKLFMQQPQYTRQLEHEGCMHMPAVTVNHRYYTPQRWNVGDGVNLKKTGTACVKAPRYLCLLHSLCSRNKMAPGQPPPETAIGGRAPVVSQSVCDQSQSTRAPHLLLPDAPAQVPWILKRRGVVSSAFGCPGVGGLGCRAVPDIILRPVPMSISYQDKG